MTQGTPWRLILSFSLPIMAGNLLQQLYNTADSIIVGQFVSQEALGAVGTCSPLAFLFIALAIGLSTGASILVAQLYGAGQLEDMRKSVSTALILLTGIGVVMTVAGVLAARPLLPLEFRQRCWTWLQAISPSTPWASFSSLSTTS